MTAVLHLFSSTDGCDMTAGFVCPGCGFGHSVRVKGHYIWEWNGNVEKPTFSPSVLVDGAKPDRRCHSFVRDGRIEFLGDCHHALKGTTVDLPPYDEDRFFRMPPAEPKS